MKISAVFVEKMNGDVECVACSLKASEMVERFDAIRKAADPEHRTATLIIRPMPWREVRIHDIAVTVDSPPRKKK